MSEAANTEKFIQLVRKRSLLYDHSDEDYKNREKKAEAWLQIAAAMGYGETKIWISRWKSLRDNFNKFKKYNESSTNGQAYKKYKNWPWVSQMSFLDDYNVRRPTENDNQPLEFEVVNYNASPNDSKYFSPLETDSLHSTVDEDGNAEEVPEYAAGSQIRCKRMKTNARSSETVFLKQEIEESKMDGVDLFFASYAQTFKNFPPRVQSMVKLEMASLFARYELQVEGESDTSAFQETNKILRSNNMYFDD